MRRYLYRLVDTLNSSLNNLTAENFSQETAAALGGATREEMQQTQADLKSLIIKNANEVRQTIEKVEQTLRSEYVAISDFGTFQENMENTITATAAGLEQEISTRSEIVNNFIAATNGYIRQGVVGYEGLTPIIGIAIGQDIQVTGVKETVGGKEYEEIDRSQNMSIWTTEETVLLRERRRGGVFRQRRAVCDRHPHGDGDVSQLGDRRRQRAFIPLGGR